MNRQNINITIGAPYAFYVLHKLDADFPEMRVDVVPMSQLKSFHKWQKEDGTVVLTMEFKENL